MLPSLLFRLSLIALASIITTTATPIPEDEVSAAGEFCHTDGDCPPQGILDQCCCQVDAILGPFSGFCDWQCCDLWNAPTREVEATAAPETKAISTREDSAVEEGEFCVVDKNCPRDGITPQCCCQTEVMQGILSGYCSWKCCYVISTSEDEAVSAREVEAVTPPIEDDVVSSRGLAEGESCVTSNDCSGDGTVH